MAESLFRAKMCFLKTRVHFFLSCFPETMYFSLADVRSWKPVMPRSVSGLVMQLMRVASVGGGDFRAEVTSEMSLRLSRKCCFLPRLSGACWCGCKQVGALAYVG
jgi:hypothetical protein